MLSGKRRGGGKHVWGFFRLKSTFWRSKKVVGETLLSVIKFCDQNFYELLLRTPERKAVARPR
jgi:hypothetical protein